MDTIMAIDANLTVNEQQAAEWGKIGTLRSSWLSTKILSPIFGNRSV